jgi:hypothetical protein
VSQALEAVGQTAEEGEGRRRGRGGEGRSEKLAVTATEHPKKQIDR